MVGSALSAGIAPGDQDSPLQIEAAGIARLRDLLVHANAANPEFENLYHRLLDVLQTVFRRLVNTFPDQIERVIAVGDWAREGIDLRNLPYDDIIVQFRLETVAEWQRAVSVAQAGGTTAALGVPLLTRA